MKPYVSPCRKAIALVVFILCSTMRAQDSYDHATEDKFISFVNELRAGAGVSPLKPDPLTKYAAGLHLLEFVKNKQASDQYEGEPSLRERLKMAGVSFGAAEQVMLTVADIDRAREKVTTSDEIKEVLLSPKYVFAGVAAMRSGSQLFLVANLIQPLQTLSMDEVEGLVVKAVQHLREVKKITPLKSLPMKRLRSVACEMAKKDSLKVEGIDPYMGYIGAPAAGTLQYAFTTFDPGTLSSSMQGMRHDPKINAISIGACFASSRTYPNGTYWVIAVLYGVGERDR
jgi:hypothetical protein